MLARLCGVIQNFTFSKAFHGFCMCVCFIWLAVNSACKCSISSCNYVNLTTSSSWLCLLSLFLILVSAFGNEEVQVFLKYKLPPILFCDSLLWITVLKGVIHPIWFTYSCCSNYHHSGHLRPSAVPTAADLTTRAALPALSTVPTHTSAAWIPGPAHAPGLRCSKHANITLQRTAIRARTTTNLSGSQWVKIWKENFKKILKIRNWILPLIDL